MSAKTDGTEDETMVSREDLPDLAGHRVLVPGGTGGVGEGVVRGFLAAGAVVAVPTRSEARSREFRDILGPAATDNLLLLVHDYTTFAGAAELADRVERDLGGIDHVVAPIGGWWSGRNLSEIDEADWQGAFVQLATTHMAILRAVLPRIRPDGSYSVIVGDSATAPIPSSGLVSMEQAAVLMMQRVAQAESGTDRRLFAFVLGAVQTRLTGAASSGVTANQVGRVAVAVAGAPGLGGHEIALHDDAEVQAALQLTTG